MIIGQHVTAFGIVLGILLFCLSDSTCACQREGGSQPPAGVEETGSPWGTSPDWVKVLLETRKCDDNYQFMWFYVHLPNSFNIIRIFMIYLYTLRHITWHMYNNTLHWLKASMYTSLIFSEILVLKLLMFTLWVWQLDANQMFGPTKAQKNCHNFPFHLIYLEGIWMANQHLLIRHYIDYLSVPNYKNNYLGKYLECVMALIIWTYILLLYNICIVQYTYYLW